MTNGRTKVILPLAGLGAGVLIGYVINGIGGAKITISGNIWTYSGFPANTALMSMGGGTNGIGSGPMNIGSTDAGGKLVITGVPNIPAGNTVLYVVFCANNPSIYASAIVKS